MQEPPNVDRELLRLRAGQQHAKIQRMKKTRLTDPAAFLDQLALHDGDLAGRTAEADKSQLQPEPKRFRKTRMTERRRPGSLRRR